MCKLYQNKADSNFLFLKKLRSIHGWFGYFLALVYKINIVISWGFGIMLYIIIIWELATICIVVYIKFFMPKLE
jgi:hypothetical protein